MELTKMLKTAYGDDQQLARYEDALKQFQKLFAEGEVLLFRAPGRVNLIGEHTDYNQGYVMPIAIDKDCLLLVRPRQDTTICLHNIEKDYSKDSFMISQEVPKAKNAAWTNYARGVAQVLSQAFDSKLRGFDGLLVSAEPYGVPTGAGLSSSSALSVVVLLALLKINDLNIDAAKLVQLASDAEWYVGTRGGIMDHYASSQAKQNHALFLDCQPNEQGAFPVEQVPLSEDYALLIVDSKVKHQNVSGAFNKRVASCRAGVSLLKKHYPQIHFLRDLQGQTWESFEALLPEAIKLQDLYEQGIDLGEIPALSSDAVLKVKARCRHVHSENQRVLAAKRAMKKRDMQTLGCLLTEAHISARDDYEISCSEIEVLFKLLSQDDDVLGARLTGAGWGGCILALVHKKDVERIREELLSNYRRQTSKEVDAFICKASDGAGIIGRQKV